MASKGPTVVLAILAAPLLILGGLLTVTTVDGHCDDETSTNVGNIPDTAIDGFGHEQLVNASQIIKAGADLGLPTRDQTIGVMTAIGESSLTVLDIGDAAGPDSRGLFQQRDNWGPFADRMDPYKSATLFFTAMIKAVPDSERQGLAPTIVAHRTQINADPYHYEKYWPTAVKIVEAMSVGSSENSSCSENGTETGTVGKDGWAKPGDAPLTGTYGPRGSIPGVIGAQFHTGLDFQAGGCDGPIWAAHDGTVTAVGTDSLSNWVVDVDHGSNTVTRYVHMYQNGILVRVGDKVKAGQQIARTGSSGASTGCHLHFEVLIEGNFVDPLTFLAERSITF